MKLLLDTHTFIWWDSEPDKLSDKALSACVSSDNIILLSIVSVWEMQIKSQMGKFNVDMPFKDLILKELEENNLQILPIELDHVFALNDLPPIHKDPFDRLLIAQSNSEGLTLVTKDQKISSYSVSILW